MRSLKHDCLEGGRNVHRRRLHPFIWGFDLRVQRERKLGRLCLFSTNDRETCRKPMTWEPEEGAVGMEVIVERMRQVMRGPRAGAPQAPEWRRILKARE